MFAARDFLFRSGAEYVAKRVQSGNLPPVLPAAPVRVVRTESRIPALQNRIKHAQIFAASRQLTQIYIGLRRYDDAARTLRAEAAQYRRKGAVDAAIIQDNKASQYETDVRLFIDAAPPQSSTRLAPSESRIFCRSGDKARRSCRVRCTPAKSFAIMLC